MPNKTMNVFYDFEFEATAGKHIDHISLGMVREDGKELYIVFNDFDTLSVARNWWLMKNVMSQIGHEDYTSYITGLGTPVKDLLITDPAAMSKAEARTEIMRFTFDITPEWWAWEGGLDFAALAVLFGGVENMPNNWPIAGSDIRQIMREKGLTDTDLPKQPKGHHNSLDDARMNVVRYNYLLNYNPETEGLPAVAVIGDN